MRINVWLRLAAFAIALVVVAEVTSAIVVYRQSIATLEESLGRELLGIVNTTAPFLNGDAHERIGRAPDGSIEGRGDFEFLRQQLVKVRDRNGLVGHGSPIYTMRKTLDYEQTGAVEFVVMTNKDASGRYFVGNLYEAPEHVRRALDGEPTVSGLYTDSEGEWISAAAPILDSYGNIVGVLQADRHVTFFRQQAWERLRGLLFVSLAAIGLGAAGALVLARSFTRPLRDLKAAAEAFGVGDLHHTLDLRRNDELGDLGAALRGMAHNLHLSRATLLERSHDLQQTNERLRDQIAERERAEAQVQYLASHDAITGLPNRALLGDRLERTLQNALRQEQTVAVFHLALDRLGLVSDSFGPWVSEDVLKDVASRLLSCVDEAATLARVGDEEFVVVLEGLDSEEAVIARGTQILGLFDEAFHLGEHELFLTASLGISVAPADGDDGQTLLRNAGAALTDAKASGTNSLKFYVGRMNIHAVEVLSLERALRAGLERDEFVAYYQPKVDARTGDLLGAETLIRWQSPEGLVSPATFIPIAEESGLIVRLGMWVFRQACRDVAHLDAIGAATGRMAINLSPRQFYEADLLETIRRVLDEEQTDPHRIEVEITESLALADTSLAIDVLKSLRTLGMTVAMDDFGTGYSSLSYLKRLPVDTVKIDQSFVRDCTSNPEDSEIIRAIVSMAHSLGLKVVAEGVETAEQVAFLREVGCDVFQGYFFGRPGPIAGLGRANEG